MVSENCPEVSEKSGNFSASDEWQPCILHYVPNKCKSSIKNLIKRGILEMVQDSYFKLLGDVIYYKRNKVLLLMFEHCFN